MFAEVRLRNGSGFSTITVLRNVSGLTFNTAYADVGAISFALPLADATSLGVGVNSVIEVMPNGQLAPNMWYTLDSSQSTSSVDGAAMVQFSGKSLVGWLTDCIVYPSTWHPSITPSDYIISTSGSRTQIVPRNYVLVASTVTFTDAGDLVTTPAAHNLALNDPVQFGSITTTTGISPNVEYYVKTIPSATTFTVSATPGGSVLPLTTNGTGTNLTKNYKVYTDATKATLNGHSFENATPGNILQTLVARGVERGGLGWLDVSSFSGTTDSAGNGWSSTLTTTYTNGTTLLQVIQDLSARRLIDFRMDQNGLKAFNYGTQATHYTADQFTLRRGVQVTEQTRTQDASSAATSVLILGDANALEELSDSSLQTAYGRRREQLVAQGGITDIPTLNLLAGAQLNITGHIQVEDTLGINDNAVYPNSRTNLVTNPSFETDTSTWSAFANITLARVTTQAAVGAASMSLTAVAAGDMTTEIAVANAMAVTVGLPYTAQFKYRAGATPRNATLFIRFLDGSNTLVSSTSTVITADTTTDWTLGSLTATAPTGAVKAQIRITVSAPVLGEVHYLDAVMFEQSASVGSYIEGLVVYYPLPWINFHEGDWVWADFDGTLKNIQVQQIAATQQDANNLQIGITLGDLIRTADEKNQRLIDNITGQNSGNYGALPNQNDFKPPAAPSGVTASATAYRDQNGIDADQVTVSWSAPTTNSDGTTLTDLDHYDVQYQLGGTSNWSTTTVVMGSTVPLAAYFSNLPTGVSFNCRVRAVDSQGNASPWANSNTISSLPKVTTTPTTPSTPTVSAYFQSLLVSWDGKDASTNTYGPEFDHLDVYIGTTSGFTPANPVATIKTNKQTSITVSGLAYGTTYYIKFIMVDKSGNSSAASAASAGTTANQLSDPDLPNKLVTGAKIADGTINTAQLTVATFGDSVAANGGFEDASTASSDNTGAAHWKVAFTNGTATCARDTSTFATGSASLKFTCPNSSSNLTIANSASNATADPAFPISVNDIWYVRFKAKASRASVVTMQARMSMAYDTAHELAILDSNNPWVGFQGVNNGNVVGLDSTGQTPTLTTSWQIFEGQLTVPTGALNPLVLGRLVLTAGSPSDNATVDVWIDDVSLAPVRGTAYIADASIINAKINDVSADKITVGTLNADVTVSARLKTADTGARVEINDAGLQAYDASEIQTVNISSVDGSATFTGTVNASGIQNSDISSSDFIITTDQLGTILVYVSSSSGTVAGTFTTSGTWTAPAGTASALIECWGAGGGASSAGFYSAIGWSPGNGGGGGEYSKILVPITAGNVYSYTVGTGGSGGTHSANVQVAGTNGGNSSFTYDTGTLTAHGGSKGNIGSSGGAGGTGTSGTGITHYNGGAGGGTSPTGVDKGGAGGGSSAGTAAAGAKGSSPTGSGGASGGTAPTGGGNGGNGGSGTTGANGGAGTAPGGGGGGGGLKGDQTAIGNGGAGARGQVKVTYYAAAATPVLIASFAGANGTDAFGTAYKAGARIYRPDIAGVAGGYSCTKTFSQASVANATSVLVNSYTTVQENNDFSSRWSTSTFTCPNSGYYDAWIHMNGVIGSTRSAAEILKNGALIAQNETPNGADINTAMVGNWCVAGDTITFKVYQSSGGAATVTGDISVHRRA